jgi:ATP phosphoribosyltransferase
MLRLALPNKGALAEPALRLMADAGYSCRRTHGELTVTDADNGVEVYFLRPRDIAKYVSRGEFDYGITGRDLLMDSHEQVYEITGLEFGGSKFCIAADNGSGLTRDDLDGRRIATAYPNLLSGYLDEQGLTADVVPLDGAVEVAIRLGIADYIADVVDTGRTLAAMGLVILGEPIMRSEAVLVSRAPDETESLFVARVRSALVARQYVMMEYDISENLLTRAVELTPGIASPTVSRLHREGWLAIKAMVGQREQHSVMDQLHQLGATGIIVTPITACRI